MPFTCFSQQSTLHPQADQNSAAMELINSVTGADEEGRSRQKILTFAAKRCFFFSLFFLFHLAADFIWAEALSLSRNCY